MSIEAVNQFLTKVSEDQELQAELAMAMEAENDRQASTELAVKHGYDFTPEELGSEIANRQSEFRAKEEANQLNEEELEAVAGGACTPAVPLGAAAISAAGVISASAVSKAKW